MDSRNLGREIYERRSPKSLEFISGRYHILREIYRNFGRVSSVKRISLYLESRARPAEKHTSRIHSTKLWLGLQTTVSTQPSESKQLIINFNQKYRILLIIKNLSYIV